MAVLLEEMEAVLQGQKKVSAVTDKADWWEGRKALDARVQVKHSAHLHSLVNILSLISHKSTFHHYFKQLYK